MQVLSPMFNAVLALFRHAPTPSPFLEAATNADIPRLKALLKAGANINEQSPDGLCALHLVCLAAAKKPAELERYLQTLKLLLSHKPNLLLGNSKEGTPISCATQASLFGFVACLLEAGAPVDDQLAENRTTPLMLAAKLNNPLIASLLLYHGARQELIDAENHLAAYHVRTTDRKRSGPFIALLAWQEEILPFLKDRENRTIETVLIALEAKTSVTMPWFPTDVDGGRGKDGQKMAIKHAFSKIRMTIDHDFENYQKKIINAWPLLFHNLYIHKGDGLPDEILLLILQHVFTHKQLSPAKNTTMLSSGFPEMKNTALVYNFWKTSQEEKSRSALAGRAEALEGAPAPKNMKLNPAGN